MALSTISSLKEFDMMSNEIEIFIKLLMNEGLLSSTMQCSKCRQSMTLRKRRGGLEWRCRHGQVECSCKSVKARSWFSNSNMHVDTHMKLVVMWAMRCSPPLMRSELKISMSTICEQKVYLRELCSKIEKLYPRIGGIGAEVEIGECALTIYTRKKGQDKKVTETVWIIGGFERDSRRCFAKLFPNRDSTTMIGIIERCVHPGTTIFGVESVYPPIDDLLSKYYTIGQSDEVKSEPIIKEEVMDEEEEMAVPQEEELDFNDEPRTLDAYWKHLKGPLKRQGGISGEQFPSHLAEFVVREWEGQRFLARVLYEMRVKE